MTSVADRGLLIFTATYNELDNIGNLLMEIWKDLPEAKVLVVDDNSPDGTGTFLQDLAKKEPRLQVIHRPEKMGVGSAHKLAFRFAAEQGYKELVTMDADFSHDPKDIKKLVGELRSHDFVIGSRFAEGGTLDYTGMRRVVSFGANFLARHLLGIRVRETTTSFRAFSKALLLQFPIERIQAEGYSFFFECTYRIGLFTNRISEVPIHFQDRRFGQSKISKSEIYRGFLTLGRLFIQRLSGQNKSFKAQRPSGI